MTHPTLLHQWHEIQEALRNRQAAIIDEIRHYPPPIPACDAQFNHLLEARTLIRQELRRVEQLIQLDAKHSAQALADFINQSQFLHSNFAHKIPARNNTQ